MWKKTEILVQAYDDALNHFIETAEEGAKCLSFLAIDTTLPPLPLPSPQHFFKVFK
jgi:hypothetical protein